MKVIVLFCCMLLLSCIGIAQDFEDHIDSDFESADYVFDMVCVDAGIDLSFGLDRAARRDKLRARYAAIHSKFNRDSIVDSLDVLIAVSKDADRVVMTKHDYLWMYVNVYIDAYQDAGGALGDIDFDHLRSLVLKESAGIDSHMRFINYIKIVKDGQ